MEFSELIKKRHSIRKYTNEPISEEQLNYILEAGRICQSARNRQPWEILILKGERKNAVCDELRKTGNPYLVKNADYIEECDTILLIYTDKENETDVDNLISIGAMIHQMCLACFDVGLGCLWCRLIAYAQESVNKLLNITDKYMVSGLLIGNYDCELVDRPRKSLEEIIIK